MLDFGYGFFICACGFYITSIVVPVCTLKWKWQLTAVDVPYCVRCGGAVILIVVLLKYIFTSKYIFTKEVCFGSMLSAFVC